jgi:hypothetical protein
MRSRKLMSSVGVLAVVVSALAALTLPWPGFAADKPAAPDKSVPEKKVEMLFVQTAKSATFDSGKLTLEGVSPTTVFFSDRPSRIAGHLATEEMIPLWGEGKDSFTKDPPNATLSTFTGDGQVANVVVELKKPMLVGDKMTYEARVLQGKAPARAEGASLFIDVIGMPLTPVSYAGAARRARRRAVVY